MSKAANSPTLAEKLAEARARLRSDVTVSRHLFQGEPSYMLHDPVSFQNHRLSLQDYRIVAALDDAYTLEENFQKLAAAGKLSIDDKDGFYRFIVRLQALGVLSLPANNGPQLYERHKKMQRDKLRSLPLQLMFLRIPLARPDVFLERTAPMVRWMFSRTFFVAWAALLALAIGLVIARSDDFFQPINTMLTASNVVVLAGVLLVLKVWHELGHGYACKLHGGRVPEMGLFLMMGAPLAYVDASAAWMFPRRRQRLVVMLGGMYFESIAAIAAVFIWAMSGPSTLVGGIAYQVVIMASAITVLFNANPLMKYDGYFILSDVIGIPNLRQRAIGEIYSLFNRKVLGLTSLPRSTFDMKSRLMLVTYGVSAGIYRVTVFLSLSAILATHAFILGMGLGLTFLITSLGGNLVKFVRYLMWSDATASVRPRAMLVAALLVIGVPASMSILPTPGGIRMIGVVGGEHEHVIRASAPGFVNRVSEQPGVSVNRGAPLLRLSNPEVQLQFEIDQAQLQAANLEMQAAGQEDPAAEAQLRYAVHSLKHTLRHTQTDLNNLVVNSPADGIVVSMLTSRDVGRFIEVGKTMATVVAGKTTVRVWLTGDQMRMISPRVGDSVSVRFPGARLGTYSGTIRRIPPAARRNMEEAAVTHAGGGDIPVNIATGESAEPMVQISIELPDEIQNLVAHKSRASVNFARSYEPIAVWMGRRFIVFVQKLMMS